MPNWRDRMAVAPLWGFFLYYTIGFGGLSLIPAGSGRHRSLLAAAVMGLFFGVSMTAVSAVIRRRDNHAVGAEGARDRIVIYRALRTGELPPDPSLDCALERMIARRRAQLRWASKANPAIFGILTLPGIALAFQNLLWLLYVAVFLGFIVLTQVSMRRGASRLSRLESALLRREPR